jgi:DUF1680 family protein
MMSVNGAGNYWDDADRFLRNTVAGRQAPGGLFASGAANPMNVNPENGPFDLCCTVSAVEALYTAWESTVTGDGNMAAVNLFANIETDWLNMESRVPGEGNVLITIKAAKNAAVRLPVWLHPADVSAAVNGSPVKVPVSNRVMLFTGLLPGDVISLSFELIERTERYILKWHENEPWKSCTDPGKDWRPAENQYYTFLFVGNTAVRVIK